MFGHLKAEDFVNLMEGGAMLPSHRSHLDECERCRATFASVQAMHSGISTMDDELPEPDWSEFRAGVRDELLSRSIQRESAVRRWTGWAVRPATAWAMSIVFALGLTTVTVLWKIESKAPISETRIDVPAAGTTDLIEAGPEKSLFDDVVSLGDEQQEQLLQMLESEQSGPVYKQ